MRHKSQNTAKSGHIRSAGRKDAPVKHLPQNSPLGAFISLLSDASPTPCHKSGVEDFSEEQNGDDMGHWKRDKI
jgi:hypothetical protein